MVAPVFGCQEGRRPPRINLLTHEEVQAVPHPHWWQNPVLQPVVNALSSARKVTEEDRAHSRQNAPARQNVRMILLIQKASQMTHCQSRWDAVPGRRARASRATHQRKDRRD